MKTKIILTAQIEIAGKLIQRKGFRKKLVCTNDNIRYVQAVFEHITDSEIQRGDTIFFCVWNKEYTNSFVVNRIVPNLAGGEHNVTVNVYIATMSFLRDSFTVQDAKNDFEESITPRLLAQEFNLVSMSESKYSVLPKNF